MKRNLSSTRQQHHQKKKKLISDIFNFLGTSLVLLFINYMTGNGYWWAMWPIGFYGLSILLSFLNFMKDELTLEMEEEGHEDIDDEKRKDKNFLPEQNQQRSQYYEDALELEDIPRKKDAEIITQNKWDDRDMV
jgi:hypothetical protein